MNKLSLRSILLSFASICCLNSCIYSDLGRTIGSIGTEIPRIVPKATTPQKADVYCGQLYRKDDRYFVALPMVWVPERRKGYEDFPVFALTDDIWNDIRTYNRPYTAEELKQYPQTLLYFEATKPELPSGAADRVISHFKHPDKYGSRGILSAELQPVSAFDPKEAEHLGLYGIDGAPYNIRHLGKRHTAAHTWLFPVQMVARLIDIPLSLVLMPLSTPIICGALAADCDFASPYWDYSRGRPYGIPTAPEYPPTYDKVK